jgi:hypothetical protein
MLLFRIGFGSRKANKTQKKTLNKFDLLSAGCSLLKAEGFSGRLDVLYEGLGINKSASF